MTISDVTLQKSVLIPIPSYGFDPTEVAIPSRYLMGSGFKVTFATPKGTVGEADVRMLKGQGLGLFKNTLMAEPIAVKTYQMLQQTWEFQNPLSYRELASKSFDAIFLPGGHDKGMIEYLESKILQNLIVDFFKKNKPVGAICHGTLLVGRSVSPETSQSVLWGRKTTGLTKLQELTAYYLTKLYLGDYYLTYPNITMEDELRSHLQNRNDFLPGPGYPIPMLRDKPNKLKNGFTVLDKNYLSARWPGDVYRFSTEFLQLLSH